MSASTIHRGSPTDSSIPLTARGLPSTEASLRAYFYSGWAFFIPYLVIYLLYYWQKWPANPVAGVTGDGGQLPVGGPSSNHSAPFTGHWLSVPPLLYVYWTLHAIHLVLAAAALHSWWQPASRLPSNGNCQPATGSPSTADPDHREAAPPPSTVHRAALRAVAPWFFLALVFYIPGAYLEWPSDPWEHLSRITEWGTLDLVANHSAGYKTLYFLAYSCIGWLPPLILKTSLNAYSTGVCLLLGWQYYLLAKAVGIDRRWAYLSVIINTLALGNLCFSFYHYYCLASTIYAQIGAIAVTRIGLEYSKCAFRSAFPWSRFSFNRFYRWLPIRSVPVSRPPAATIYLLPKSVPSTVPEWTPDSRTSAWAPSSFTRSLPGKFCLQLRSAASMLMLLLLIACNHLQGIGIAGLSIGAIIIWRVIEWKRSMVGWLILIAALASITVHEWFLCHPGLNQFHRSSGWLTTWGSFNLFDPSSPAFVRTIEIIGGFGVLNVVAGLWLLRRNHIVGWLTLTPIVSLMLPCFALPLAHAITSGTQVENIVTFHRMLFAIPIGLAAVTILAVHNPAPTFHLSASHVVLPVALLVLLVAPASFPTLNRAWHVLHRSPNDLRLAQVSLPPSASAVRETRTIVASAGISYCLKALDPILQVRYANRLIHRNAIDCVAPAQSYVRTLPRQIRTVILLMPSRFSVVTPSSVAGRLSGHWAAHSVAFEYVGQPELLGATDGLDYRATIVPGWTAREYYGPLLHRN